MVSIHAPLWGATYILAFYLQVACSFNPRTPVGCDNLAHTEIVADMVFQSTHPCGVRLADYQIRLIRKTVSIHAPLWGATLSLRPTTRLCWFQSTHPCGVRRRRQQTQNWSRCFNPRTPVGCDFAVAIVTMLLRRFNPRTPVGCDAKRIYLLPKPLCFNPRTPVGCDAFKQCEQIEFEMFQSTHPCGVRHHYKDHGPA